MSSGYVLRTAHGDGEERRMSAPTVGIFTATVAVGDFVSPGQLVGMMEVLGVRHPLRTPEDVAGRVVWKVGENRTRVPAQYGDPLLTVSVGASMGVEVPTPDTATEGDAAFSFVAPMSGRFYGRPTPSEAAFLSEGDTIRKGQTIGLLEVMKTFNRLVYQGESLPESAIVRRVVPNDGDDVVRGDVILTLETADEE